MVCGPLGLGMSEDREAWRASWLVPDTENLQTPMLGTLY